MSFNSSLRVLLASPFLTANRGNSITTQRLHDSLQTLGIDVVSLAYAEAENLSYFLKELQNCDVLHVFHAYRFAEALQQFSPSQRQAILSWPTIVTMTGTDVNHDIYASYRASLMTPVLHASRAIAVFNQNAFKAMADGFAELRSKLICIPLGVYLPESTEELTDLPPLPDEGAPLILFPAGIRRVKEIAYLFQAFDDLYQKWKHLQVWLVGPVLEPDYGEMVLQHIQSRPYFHYLGEQSHSLMKSLYRKATLVINTSISEGQPQAILEAMSTGALVAVRAIPGNLAVVKDGLTGLTFSTPEDFTALAHRVFQDPVSLQSIRRAARQVTEERHSPLAEAQAYCKLYSSILSD